jgi:hypothetical protein
MRFLTCTFEKEIIHFLDKEVKMKQDEKARVQTATRRRADKFSNRSNEAPDIRVVSSYRAFK